MDESKRDLERAINRGVEGVSEQILKEEGHDCKV